MIFARSVTGTFFSGPVRAWHPPQPFFEKISFPDAGGVVFFSVAGCFSAAGWGDFAAGAFGGVPDLACAVAAVPGPEVRRTPVTATARTNAME